MFYFLRLPGTSALGEMRPLAAVAVSSYLISCLLCAYSEHDPSLQGFLPEAWDNFAVDYVYPTFTPTLGLFLAISVVYGLLKVDSQPGTLSFAALLIAMHLAGPGTCAPHQHIN